jgi:hypothetical protein
VPICAICLVTPATHGQRATVVVNCHIAVAAICVEAPNPLEPLPWPELSAALWQTCPELTILERAEFLRPVNTADLSDLGYAELDQINYWKPATIGELVFNWWD